MSPKKFETNAIRQQVNRTSYSEHSSPLFLTSSFVFEDAEHMRASFNEEIEKNAIKVDTFDYQTNIPGIFAIGDVNTYPGKLKLILCGFHEATLMCQAAYKIINPGKRYIL